MDGYFSNIEGTTKEAFALSHNPFSYPDGKIQIKAGMTGLADQVSADGTVENLVLGMLSVEGINPYQTTNPTIFPRFGLMAEYVEGTRRIFTNELFLGNRSAGSDPGLLIAYNPQGTQHNYPSALLIDQIPNVHANTASGVYYTPRLTPTNYGALAACHIEWVPEDPSTAATDRTVLTADCARNGGNKNFTLLTPTDTNWRLIQLKFETPNGYNGASSANWKVGTAASPTLYANQNIRNNGSTVSIPTYSRITTTDPIIATYTDATDGSTGSARLFARFERLTLVSAS